MTDEDLRRWDDWFEVVRLTSEWDVVKATIPRTGWLAWATIIETNRISIAVEEKNAEVQP